MSRTSTMNRIRATVGVAFLLSASVAGAHVLDPKADKDAFRLRADVARQLAAYASCVSKASLACEAKGTVSTPECDVETGAVAYEAVPGHSTAKFVAALGACEDRLDLAKKGDDYEGIGCPGDCGAGAGVQACTGLAAYGESAKATLRAGVADLAVLVDEECAGLGATSSPERIECVANASKQLAKYSASLLKCASKCENDSKGTSGGGASTNAGACTTAGASPEFEACDAKAASKLTDATPAARAAVSTIADSLTNEVFNAEAAGDPASPAGTLSPCGTCGDGVREGTESCDGADLGTCADCNSSCACIVDPVLDDDEGTFCTTTVDTTTADYQPLCAPTAGSGRHFRLEGVQTFANNGFAYLALGFPEAPAGNPATSVGDGRFVFTGGKSQSCSYAWSWFRYSGITDPDPAQLCTVPSIFGEYGNGPQTVCMDVSADVPPRVTFWATGKNGADCRDKSTLTPATAAYSKDDWSSADNQPVNATTHFVKVNSPSLATVATVAVSSNTVLP